MIVGRHYTPPRPSPRFGGLGATTLAGKSLLNQAQLLNAINKDVQEGDTPYVGNLPAEMHHDKAQDIALLQSLDQAASEIRDSDFPESYLTKTGLTLTKVNSGNFGQVYQLQAGGKRYAFKVFKKTGKTEHKIWGFIPTGESILHTTSGPFAETASGYYLTSIETNAGKGTKDLAQFYISNPLTGWHLAEFIDENSPPPSARSGLTISEHDYVIGDQINSDNNINGIRVDYGCIIPKRKENQIPSRDFF